MNLSPAQQGTLVVCAINWLPHKNDLLERRVDFGCCNGCCASCAILADLIDNNTIDEVIKLAPDHQYQRSDWWVDGKFDRTWADAWWRTIECPAHDEDDDPEE